MNHWRCLLIIHQRDNLKGFTEAIRAVFPESTKQICIVYQIRNSCRHLVCKDRKAFAVAMKSIYTLSNRKAAALALDHLEAVWGSNTALFNHQLAQQLGGINCILGISP